MGSFANALRKKYGISRGGPLRISKVMAETIERKNYGEAGRTGKLLSAPKTYKQPKMAENKLNVKGSVGGKTNTLG